MDTLNTPILSQELEPLNAQIEQVRENIGKLEDDLSLAEAELETYAADKQRFDALRDICNALDKLTELEADELFWTDFPGSESGAGHVKQLRDRIASFEEEIRSIEENREALKAQKELHLDSLDILYEEVREAWAREERRQEEFIIEREISPAPHSRIIMPWASDGESEKRFRRSLLVAMLLSIVFGTLIPWVNLPLPDPADDISEIPERLAMLVKKDPPEPEPVARPEPTPEEEKLDKEKKTSEDKKKDPEKKETKVASKDKGTKAARKKAESTGVLAFKDSFKDLMDETPVAKLGTEARISKQAPNPAGAAKAQRSLVARQATGSSGGIASGAVSRNLGTGGKGDGQNIGGVGFSRVESAVAGLAEEEGRPLSDGPGPARTDEEIQIVFDRYKATLYRIYNKELRRDPTLRGKLLLKITIEPGGEVSLCEMESSDLGSDVLVSKIIARVERFNFGPKEDVPTTTILYPIDFLPAG